MPTTLTRPKARLRRSFAGVVTAALAASSLALLPGTAQAADAPLPAPSLTWKISQQFVDHLSTRTLTDGATFDAASGFTFVGGTGYVDSGNGAASIAYQGTVKGAFVNLGTEYYSVTVADPIVTVDAQGEGTVSAVVSSVSAAQGSNPANQTPPTRVVVTSFDATASEWTTTSGRSILKDTPDWAGVLPADSAKATALGIGAGKPVDGKAFAPTFLEGIVPGVRAHFYASGATSDTKKNPAELTAAVDGPAVTVTTTSASPTGGLNLSVTGSGFTRATNPGDAGVYVGLAPSGGLPDTTKFDTSAFAGANWVMPGAINETTGAFTSTINAPTSALDPTKSYSLYTWRAHAHSTPSQDSETPVVIDFSALSRVTSAPSVTAPSSTYGAGRTVTVTIPQRGAVVPTGTVTLTGPVAQSAVLSGGTATFQLPRTLPAGSSTITVAYSGDDTYVASSATRTVTIAKAGVRITRNKITRKPTSKKAGKTSLTLRSTTGGPAVTGKVTVTFTKKGHKTKTKTVTVKSNMGTVTIPKLTKGTWKISAKYTGTTNFAKTATVTVGAVKVTR
jgi:hypothetical protein